ncbi:casein kinase II subunit beta-like isoform X1 [Selaginella moellendorffii]|uniref:casein kinase II subunit beta-like isoform X1 n=2 Tax=Selaginella moellendorffii TaxID=88036 RepID=UPI000D1C6DCC|nr:casein kinase II subunit beta-like isoform X1 [Selaginella moellendorffii]|eukprot:XP_024530042.1 casein kinase II subunit beta-like isoform X1 [Selaginella moellendorffii]
MRCDWSSAMGRQGRATGMREIHSALRCRQLLRSHRRFYCLAASKQMKNAAEGRPKKIKFFVGSQRSNVEALKREKHLENSPGWIEAFCSQKENDLFVRVDTDFIRDQFNLHGLSNEVLDYHGSLRDILETYRGYFDEEAQKLYGLIHRRYILSTKGLEAMARKFKHEEFEKCPRSCCEDQTCLPVGLSDDPGVSTVRFFCPRCEDVFDPIAVQHRSVDGAYFGPTFAHLLLLTHPMEIKPCVKHPSSSGYVPRIFGFKIHKPSASSDDMEVA